PLDALSGPGGSGPASANADPFGPELSLDSLGPSPSPAGPTGEMELDLQSPGGSSGPGDPFGSALDSPFGAPPASSPSPLDDPFGSSLESASPFDAPASAPPARSG